jgi:hypothetical protein
MTVPWMGRACDLKDVAWIEWLDLLTPYTQHSELRQLKRCRYFHTLQFTVTRALVFSIFISSYPGNGLWQFHC